jgi:glyoxylase-like metal-dependent hydrolase (beta-lactamase superfamily II)
MSGVDGILAIPAVNGEERVRVFRRALTGLEGFEGMEVDAYVVLTKRYLVVFDTLLCPEDMAIVMHEVQDALAGRQLLVVNSHADWDHTWGNAYFTAQHPAPIIAHEHCLQRMESEEAKTELQDYQQRYPVFQNVALVPPTLTFSSIMTIYGGDLTLALIPAPGHSADHIAAWIPELRVLLAFDAVEKPVPVINDAPGVPAMFATLERFLALEPLHVLCSHSKTTSIDIVKDNLAYLREIKRRSRVLLAAHRPTQAELEHASLLINYPFDEVISDLTHPIDPTLYTWAHDHNVRCILQWLMS